MYIYIYMIPAAQHLLADLPNMFQPALQLACRGWLVRRFLCREFPPAAALRPVVLFREARYVWSGREQVARWARFGCSELAEPPSGVV